MEEPILTNQPYREQHKSCLCLRAWCEPSSGGQQSYNYIIASKTHYLLNALRGASATGGGSPCPRQDPHTMLPITAAPTRQGVAAPRR